MRSLPFPFSFKRVGRERWRKKAIRSAGKERQADDALVSEGFSSETDPAVMRSKGRAPAGGSKTPAGPGVDWTDEPYSDRRLSPRACLNRQAGFTAARPAANWIPSSAAGSMMPTHNLGASGQPSVVRRVDEDIPRDADCGLEDWSECFRSCAARWIGRAKRGSAREEDRGTEVRKHWARASDRVPILHSPVPTARGQCLRRSGVRRKASTGHDGGVSRETNPPTRKDRRTRADCNRRRRERRRLFLHDGLMK
jgi:hypothetical protein